MNLDRARALATSDAPVSSDTMGRAQLVVLLAVLDSKPTGMHALLAAGPVVRVDYHRHGSRYLYRGRVLRVSERHVSVEVAEDLGSSHCNDDDACEPHVKIGRVLDCPIEHVAIEAAQTPPQPQPAQTRGRR